MSDAPSGREETKSYLEVERKFRLTKEESDCLPDKLSTLSFTAAGQVTMTDSFLPTQNAGDMMRVRKELEDEKLARTVLTLKSWVVTADGGKERKETEREITGTLAGLLLVAGRWLKGSELLSFSKHRRLFEGCLSGLEAVVSLDSVDNLGVYSGCYLEVEILVPVGADVTPARQQIAEFVSSLLGEAREPVKLSYMEMLKRSIAAVS
jgi:adenylate cyclase class IV